MLKDGLQVAAPPVNLIDYVHGFRRRLFLAGRCAKKNMANAQSRMKDIFDRRAESRLFCPGDQVLALLPIPGSPFRAKFSGPYDIVRQVTEQDYVIATPNRRKSSQLCHVNLLKPYYSPSSRSDVTVDNVVLLRWQSWVQCRLLLWWQLMGRMKVPLMTVCYCHD